MSAAMRPRCFQFVCGAGGPWRILRSETIVGESFASDGRLTILPTAVGQPVAPGRWVLQGIVSNERYVKRDESDRLTVIQEGLGRPAASLAALIPIRKTAAWWALAQDQRREIFEEQSRHVAIGLRYLPPIARRLHHCRDLAGPQPFDFLTWFEFAPEHEPAFNEMLALLRATEEWKFVDREVDIRLALDT